MMHAYPPKYHKGEENTKEKEEMGGNEWKLVCKKTLTAPKTNQADKEPTMKRTKWIINEKAKLLK